MKTLSNLLESFDSNPGNKLGVTNHYTPIFNIITNVRNLFAPQLSVVVEPGEDGVSLKLHSFKFVNEKEINKVLDDIVYPSSGDKCTLRNYIKSQGLDKVKMINLGMYFVVYFCPSDIRTKENPDACCDNGTCKNCTCKEMLQSDLQECEISSFALVQESGDDDEELEDKSKEEIMAIINSTDKVKGAAKLEEKVKEEIELPENVYFKAVKDQDGNESIALRYKFERKRPFGKKVEFIKSLMNIYKEGDQAVWVDAFLEKDKNPDEINTLIENILKMIGATETNEECVYAIKGGDDVKDNTNKEEENKEDNKKDENGENTNETSTNSENNEESKSEEDKSGLSSALSEEK